MAERGRRAVAAAALSRAEPVDRQLAIVSVTPLTMLMAF
jgi:hypothetical protein